MSQFIPYGKQCIDEADIEATVETLHSDWLTQGPKVREFEKALAAYCGANFAVAVSSGTAALHLAVLAAGLKEGLEAITSPISFVATSNCAIYVGAKPIFADIDYETVNIDPREIEKKITCNTKVILPIHFAGLPADLVAVSQIANRNKIIVIEDACHALGAEYKVNERWYKVGSCAHSNMAVFSFHPVKHITTGEGGAITINDENVYKKLCALRSHGIYKDESSTAEGSWCYDMRDLGLNYRITDVQCSLGLSQLKKIDLFIRRRQEIANEYNEAFAEFGTALKLPTENETKRSAWHLYLLRFRDERLRAHRKEIFDELHERNIKVQVHYRPINRNSYYEQHGYGTENFHSAEKYYSECVSLPIYYSLSDNDLAYVIYIVKDILKKYI